MRYWRADLLCYESLTKVPKLPKNSWFRNSNNKSYRAGRLQVRSTLNLPFSPPLCPFDLPFECKPGSTLAMLGLDGKPLFVSSWWSKCYFKSTPVKQGIGAGTGDFDFLIKFPTRTENLRKGSAEGTREGPLGGTLEVFIAGLGWSKVFLSPFRHLPVRAHDTHFWPPPCLRR